MHYIVKISVAQWEFWIGKYFKGFPLANRNNAFQQSPVCPAISLKKNPKSTIVLYQRNYVYMA